MIQDPYLYLSPPDVGQSEMDLVLDALASGWVAPLGPHVDGFETDVAAFVGARQAVALSSGTAAIHLGLLALGVRPGDEVLVPTMTFGATAFAVAYVGAQPVFVDSERQSWNLDPHLLSALLKRRAEVGRLPAAVLSVDVFGQTADYGRIIPICEEYGVPLLEDAAEALGATHGEVKAGKFGRAGIFSFNGNKIMTTSGGGMLVTDDGDLSERVQYLATQARQPVPWYEHTDIGYNYRLSNVLAALGRAQLTRLPSMIERRRHHRERYRQILEPAGVEIVRDADWGVSNSWLTVALFKNADLPITVRESLARQGIEARPVWKPMHRQPVFVQNESALNGVADDLFARGLCLPSGSVMSDADGERVANLIFEIVDGS